MQIPAFDLARQNQLIWGELQGAINDVVSRGYFILGRHVAEFEQEAAEYCGVRYAIGVANGSDALYLALAALGIGPGDEVVVPGFTFFATAGAVVRTGATPVFADVEAESLNLSAASFSAAITPKTKAVIPVHLYGNPAEMDLIMAVARDHGIRVIEDCAQAIGARYQGQCVGSIGDLGTFSFFPTKNLGAFGDGGMVTTDDSELAERVRILRVHGARKKYFHEDFGINSRLDELQASILRVKIRHLEEWTARRREIAMQYGALLAGCGVGTPCPTPSAEHVFHQYTITTADRDELLLHLKENGVGASIYYPLGLHLQPVFEKLTPPNISLPVTEWATRSVLSLPMFPELTGDEIAHVASCVREWASRRAAR